MKLFHLMKKAGLACTLVSVSLIGAVSFVYDATAAVQPEMQDTTIVGATPPMGYSTWNAVRFNVNEELIRKVADSMVSSGLRDLGYKYVNIDDGWQGSRDANGKLTANKTKFPSGMKALSDYVHSKGLKIGIYTDIGQIGCGGNTGSYGYYQQDVNQFTEWGYDYVKVDACGADAMGLDFKTQYQQFKDALSQANPKRDILFNICEWGKQQPWKWAPSIGNTWRVGYDIDNQGDYWKGVLYEIDQTSPHADVAGPGHFNDPDSLEVGVIADKYPGQKSLSYEESKANFSMWALLAAPLMLGLDVTTLDEPGSYSSKFADIVTNAEVIAVDQDVAGIQGTKVAESTPGLQVYAKPLISRTSGSRAVVLLNRTDAPAAMTVTSDQIGLMDRFSVRDLWQKKEMGTYTASYTATVPAHGSVMLKISGTNDPTPVPKPTGVSYEAEADANTLSGTADKRANSGASGGYIVGNVGNGSGNSLQFNQIQAETAGSYELAIHYINGGGSRKGDLSINGAATIPVTFPSTGGWTTVGTQVIKVNLNAGSNALKFSNSTAGDYAPDFDKIVVTPFGQVVPSSVLTGEDQVIGGDPFHLRFGFTGVSQQVYAQDIELAYDASQMEYVSAKPLLEGIRIVDTKNTGSKLRFIVASEGGEHAVTGKPVVLEVTFKAKAVTQAATATVSVSRAALGDAQGNEIVPVPASMQVRIVLPTAGIPGDMNNDGKVSIGDLSIVAANYGKTSESPDWESIKHLDSNHDGKIDITDLAFIAQKILE
ncbi:cohesin domain-containing protein [Paenibacillus planticolens]|nr:cohesin domain-containing protein [Paenibacillus planticolens]